MKNNWEETTLNDICKKIFAGGDKPVNFSKIENKKYSIPVVANGIENDGLLGFTDVATVIDKAITISARGTIGFVCKRNKPFCPIVRLIVVIPKTDKATIDFLYYLLQTLIPKSNGSSIPQLTIPNFKYSKIKLPPLQQQKEIVEKLDKAFADIDKLTEIAKQNLENSKELFNSHLNKIFTQNNNNWEEKKFNDCIEKIQYTAKILKKDFLEYGKYPIISQEEEYINGYWNNKKDLFKITKPVVIFGDHTKKIKYVDFDFVLGADGVKILQPIDEIDTKFFYYTLLNMKIRDLGYARHYKLLQEKFISFPASLKEQKQIVKILDNLQEQTKKLEEIYNKKIELAKELKQSVLHKELQPSKV